MTANPMLSAADGAVVRTDMRRRPVESQLRSAGWDVATVQTDALDHTAILVAIGQALQFPSQYGENLDGLWDCLRDVGGPTALVWPQWQDAAVADPQDWAAIMQVLRERTDEAPPFAVVLCNPDAEDSDDDE